MISALIRCDGANHSTGRKTAQWDRELDLHHRGPQPTLRLDLNNLSHKLLSSVDSTAADLIRIAAYVYAADQSISRGGLADVYGSHWVRNLSLAIPVSNVSLWSSPQVYNALVNTLDFVSDDRWAFAFTELSPELRQLTIDFGDSDALELLGSPQSVILFSGGMDSLCAAIAAQKNGDRPVLLSHQPAPAHQSRQKSLASELRRRSEGWNYPHLGVQIHRRGVDHSETTQRTRSFLYASLGAAVASELGISQLILADNGVTSIQPPINDQLLGAMATRSTHPKFIYYFNELASIIFSSPPVASNPFILQTRSEVLSLLKQHNMLDMLQETFSCAHGRGRTLSHPHCGVCSQCIERRFSTLALGADEFDIAERYGIDIFTDPLPSGPSRTAVLSYVRFALEIAEDPNPFQTFPQLYDCITPSDVAPASMADDIISLLKRHADTVISVMKEQLSHHDLVTTDLPSTCLLRLVGSGAHLAREALDNQVPPDRAPSIAVFTSYAHEDRELRGRLSSHLATLRRSGVIDDWYDGEILPGGEFGPEILEHLNEANVILLLVSSDFLNSDFCWTLEMRRAMERQSAGAATVVPIILRPVDWTDTPFRHLKALPEDGKPVTDRSYWISEDKALADVATGIRKVISSLRDADD